MKSKITYEVHYSNEQVNFHAVTIKNSSGQLITTIYSKPTDSHVHLNPTSPHPAHVIKIQRDNLLA